MTAVINLSLKDVLELLDVRDTQEISGEPRQMEKFRKWIERLVAARGEDFVRENRRDLFAEWKLHAEGGFKTCV